MHDAVFVMCHSAKVVGDSGSVSLKNDLAKNDVFSFDFVNLDPGFFLNGMNLRQLDSESVICFGLVVHLTSFLIADDDLSWSRQPDSCEDGRHNRDRGNGGHPALIYRQPHRSIASHLG